MTCVNHIAAAVVIAVLSGPAYGQLGPRRTILVSGRITDSNGSPLRGATVALTWTGTFEEISASRTGRDGRFAYWLAPGRSYELVVEAPGVRTLTIPLNASAASTDLKDVAMEAGTAPASASATRAAQIISLAKVPQELPGMIMRDLEFPLIQDCLKDRNTAFEELIRTTWFVISKDGARALLVEGVGSCIAGANNGPLLVYARFGQTWRKVFDEIGNRLNALPSRTRGYSDLERWQHGSAFESDRFIHRFNGTEYTAVRCDSVEFGSISTSKPYSKPKYTPCTGDWRDAER